MQEEKNLVNNSVRLIGIIDSEFKFSHEVYSEGFYSFYLKIPRISESTDVLPIIISERLIDVNQSLVGSYVEMTGQIRSYNNTNADVKSNRLLLTVFTRDIVIIESNDNDMPNEICLNGFICKPPIFRTTPFGREIADLLIAVNRSYNKSDYIPCIAWGRNARFTGRLKVGDNIRLWGRMQSRNYQKKYEDGNIEEKVAYEVSISKIESSKLNNISAASIETD
jgi:primosomal replication protein N